MKLIVENEAFAKALAQVKSCIVVRTTIPILSHVVLVADASGLTIRATNLDRETEVKIPASVEASGAVAVPGEVLSALSRRLAKGGQSSIELNGERIKIVSGASKFDLRTLPATDFPEAKQVATQPVSFTMPAETVRQLIQSVAYACDPKEGGRAFCWGVHLIPHGRELLAVASDGLRLAMRSTDLPKGAVGMPAVCVPKDAANNVAELLAGDGDVELIVSPALFEVRRDAIRFASALLSTDAVPWEKVVPKGSNTQATVRPYVLREAIERVCVAYLGELDTAKRNPTVEITLANNEMQVAAGSRGREQAMETVETESVSGDLVVRMNAQFVTEMLACWPENVSVAMMQEKRGDPIRFSSDAMPEMTHVVMPIMKG